MLARKIPFNVFVYLIIFLFGAFSLALKLQSLSQLESQIENSFSLLVILDVFRSEASLYLFLAFLSSVLLVKTTPYLKVRRAFVLAILGLSLFSGYSLSIFGFLSSESVSIKKALYWLQETAGLTLQAETLVFLFYLLPLVVVAAVIVVFFFCLDSKGETKPQKKSFLIKLLLAILFLAMAFIAPMQKVMPYSNSHHALVYLIKSAFYQQEQTQELDENAYYGDWQIAFMNRHPEKNLVIIILDTMQHDVLMEDSDNEVDPVMPYLQSLSEQSLVFNQAYGTVPNTTKSLISIFCGILPYLDFETPESKKDIAVSCLPEIMSKFFYRSVFFQGERSQFEHRGDLLKQIGFQEIFSAETFRPDKQFESNAGRYDDEYTLDYTKRWLSRHYNKRFVMGFLLSNNAYPYQIPDKEGVISFSSQKNRNAHLNALHYSDSVIKNLLDTFRQLGIYRETVFVFVSAHGEAFGEHGKQQHNNVAYNEVSRVLFMVHDGAHQLEKSQNNSTVSQLQILPSALHILGLNASGMGLYESVFQGGNRAVGSCYEPDVCQFYADGQYKYIDNFNEKSAELFDLEADPGEKNNLLEEKPEIAESMSLVLKNQIQFHQSAVNNFYKKQVE